MKDRVFWIDFIKAIGIILVIFQHVTGFGFGLQIYDSVTEILIYSFNMPIFFFVSGFLAQKRREQVNYCLLWNKFKSLVFPAVIFYVILDLCIRHNGPLGFISGGFHSYWFTFTLFECFVLYYFFRYIIKNATLLNISLVLIGALGYVYLAFKPSVYIPNIFDPEHIAKYFLFFVIGLIASQYQSLFRITLKNQKLITISFLLTILSVCFMSSDWLYGVNLFFVRNILLRFLTTFLLISLALKIDEEYTKLPIKFVSCMKWIGKHSLPIYLLQYFFLPDFINNGLATLIIPNQHDMCVINVYVISAFYTVIILALCWLFIYILQHSNFIAKYFFAMKRK